MLVIATTLNISSRSISFMQNITALTTVIHSERIFVTNEMLSRENSETNKFTTKICQNEKVVPNLKKKKQGMALHVLDSAVADHIRLKMANSENMITARTVICTDAIVTDRQSLYYGLYRSFHGSEPQNNSSTLNPVVRNLFQQSTQFNNQSGLSIENYQEVCSKYQEYQSE
ncbi:hypothetical protein CHS0354_031649 [Potamilus streckersoni]|uniref:Uncharacterized protein n=1 Tax=Potamilus streckersoni TaxID=2493646 RepID=A0AAE0SQF8_9BIVA|nr:hypothetical protein CHS0354_031649 [Potamilus streckersoni]